MVKAVKPETVPDFKCLEMTSEYQLLEASATPKKLDDDVLGVASCPWPTKMR